MEIKKNHKFLEKKHLLMRQLNNEFITQKKYDEEIKTIEAEIQKNIAEVLNESRENLIIEMKNFKTQVKTDGDMKRGVANIIIKLLEKDFTIDELRGIFRQGYKIMRLKWMSSINSLIS